MLQRHFELTFSDWEATRRWCELDLPFRFFNPDWIGGVLFNSRWLVDEGTTVCLG